MQESCHTLVGQIPDIRFLVFLGATEAGDDPEPEDQDEEKRQEDVKYGLEDKPLMEGFNISHFFT